MLRKTGRACYEVAEGAYETLQAIGRERIDQKPNVTVRATRDVNDQQRSIFFAKLPVEVRDIIYEYVFCTLPRRVIILVLGPLKTRSYCVQMDPQEHYWYYALNHVHRAPTRPSPAADESARGLAALLRTCCRIYNEAAPLLYARAVFSFSDLADISYFIRTMIPQRLDMIQSLMLHWSGCSGDIFFGTLRYRNKGTQWKRWAGIWKAISNMKELRELRIQIDNGEFLASQIRRRQIGEPMMAVKGLRFFELMLPYSEIDRWDFLQDPPFKIVRKFTRSA